ncbi:MAG: DUF6529 family protein [Actinomycetes bacterium]
MSDPASIQQTPRTGWLLAGAVLVGAAVSVALGVYGRDHTPTFESVLLLGFPTQIQMKVWLAVVVSALALVQVFTALRMYGRLGGGSASRGVALTHRISGSLAVLISLPIAWHCLWSLGFQTYTTRVYIHSIAGCLFYGAFVAKMLTLHVHTAPNWALPVLGALTFTILTVVVLTSAGWWFTHGQVSY